MTVNGAWLTNAPWGDMDQGLANGRMFIAFEAETIGAATGFLSYLHLTCTKIELWPVIDYAVQLRAFAAGDAEGQAAAQGQTGAAAQASIAQAKTFIAAGSPGEALALWHATPMGALSTQVAARRSSRP
ncbi:MAG: hypothetical protein DWI58_01700 [Chloroflexi bacterium]|nr:MAG: hypothetical protein DWI58_01700 [Chloroflexota bacterium]